MLLRRVHGFPRLCAISALSIACSRQTGRPTDAGRSAADSEPAADAVEPSDAAASSPPWTPPPESAPHERLTRFLPDTLGTFVAGNIELGSVFARRRYSDGPIRIDLTIGEMGSATMTYDDWLKASADYPQAKLAVSRDRAAGFYDCTTRSPAEHCDVHIHLRNGRHIELMSAGTATRADLDALLAKFPLAALASPVPRPGLPRVVGDFPGSQR
jgi:hypothetical protein